MQKLALYAAPELGAYGYDDKPWYRPGARMTAFLDELDARGLSSALTRYQATPATDSDLHRFHHPENVARIMARCAEGVGSLDCAAPPVIDDARRILTATDRASVGELVPSMTVEAYLSYLEAEGLLVRKSDHWEATESGRHFLTEPDPWLSGPTFARPGVEVAARYVCGAVLDATRRILDGEIRTAFLPISGFHHAMPDRPRMYCLYNDPALAIAAALDRIDGPVAYVDIDIHQGDGVYEGFADHPRVVGVDLHEDWSTLFPWTPERPGAGSFPGRPSDRGRGLAAGNWLQIPLSPNTDDASYLESWSHAEAHLRAARPRFVVFEAGVDGLAGDPMSHQRLSSAALVEVTRRVRQLADEHADGRLLVLGGGGYEQTLTASAWVDIVQALAD